MQPLILVNDLTKAFKDEIILEKINLEIYPKEIIGIIGRSGAGKTTLLKILMGELSPDQGNVFYNFKKQVHVKLLRKDNAFYSIFGFSPQDCSFYENLTVEENLSFYSALYGLDKNNSGNNLLNWMDLHNKKRTLAKNLSAGMQKRLDIACALIHNPKILFLDEPVSHLDSATMARIWSLISKLNSLGTTIIITSNFLEEIRPICSRIIRLHNKKLENV